ncbi:MAG: T9SS type A sorting domain-containing protein [Burkholderiales bacterium]|nr:T9SS type A sorting domain-containing protein [Bacteroidia bacterium]
MKRILIVLFVLAELMSYGQAKIGMSPVFSFTPVSAGTPSSIVNFGDTVSLKVYVKNSGNVTFNGFIKLNAFRDTTNGVLCDSIGIGLNLLPNDSISHTLSFTPISGPNAFKSGGNGNTIVVWPIIIFGTGVNGDSVRPKIWINNINSIFEFEKNPFKLYPNPVLHELSIKSQNSIHYKKITIYDQFARKVKEIMFTEVIDVSDLTAGSYWMIISSDNKSHRVNFIKE